MVTGRSNGRPITLYCQIDCRLNSMPQSKTNPKIAMIPITTLASFPFILELL